MKSAAPSLSSFVKLSAAILALSAPTGVAFAGWLESGPRMLMAMAESGLAWCF